MKSLLRILSIAVFGLPFLINAQTSPSPAGSATSARTDVYHVYFGKAAAGKAAQLLELLKAPDPKAPMPGHVVILRHQEGDSWDFCAIEHLGTKATVDAQPFQVPANMRDATEWHNDTFVNGPSWTDFCKEMGISDDQKAKTGGSVYVVSVYRPQPGHREDLEKFLSAPPQRPNDTSSGNMIMQHLEGGPWTFLAIARYNSWQDFATNEMNNVAQTNKNQGGWFELRQQSSFHTDTVTTRVAP